jgi:hypothetical protein
VIEKSLAEVANRVAAKKAGLCQHCGSMIPKGKHKALTRPNRIPRINDI